MGKAREEDRVAVRSRSVALVFSYWSIVLPMQWASSRTRPCLAVPRFSSNARCLMSSSALSSSYGSSY
jgi:hypothetical protein